MKEWIKPEIEEWRWIKEYEGIYQVSNIGRVRSFINNKWGILKEPQKILSTYSNKKGYQVIRLRKDKKLKRLTLHRLVAIHFIDNPKNKPQVNHIDGDKNNNKVTNLEWNTAKENVNHALNNNLMDTQKQCIKIDMYDLNGNYIKSFDSVKAVGNYFGKSYGASVSHVLRGDTPSWLGHTFKYSDPKDHRIKK